MTARLGTRKRKRLKLLLLERDGPWCTWCCRTMVDEQILPGEDVAEHMTVEHMIPTSLGGTDDLTNLALACFRCNNDRGDQTVDYFPEWALASAYETVVEIPHRGEG